eukprot:jgi/Bigna1/145955/aug1.106_g20663
MTVEEFPYLSIEPLNEDGEITSSSSNSNFNENVRAKKENTISKMREKSKGDGFGQESPLGIQQKDIALCIAGGRGRYMERFKLAKYIKYQVLDRLDADVFIHTDAPPEKLRNTLRWLKPVRATNERIYFPKGEHFKEFHRKAGRSVEYVESKYPYYKLKGGGGGGWDRKAATDNATSSEVGMYVDGSWVVAVD